MQTTTTYELVELAGTRGKLAVTLTSSGKSKDGKLTISEKGKGEIAFDLVKVGVGAARTEIRSEVTVDDNDMHLGQVNMKTMTVNGRAR